MKPCMIQFTVLKAYLPYLINGDAEGYDEGELERLDAYLDARTPKDVDGASGHWSCEPDEMNDTNFMTDEVTGLKGDCCTLLWFCVPSR